MPRYSDDSRDKVRDAVDFADLVGQRTELRRAGVNRLTGLCPFHDERSPSFGIDPVEKLYHCFGCGAGGDLFTFVMETESIGFGEALELLADRYGVELERTEEDPRAAERRAHRDRLLALLERTAAFYVRMLWEAPEAEGAREYLAGRGLEEPTLREFRVGYSPAGWDRVAAASQKAGFSAAELVASGLATRGGRSGLLDRFRGRLMFPWADSRGRVLGFGARALAEGDNPKYLNSAEGEVFSKGRQVYGTHVARSAAAKAGSVVLVEGYTDVIALHQAGVRHAVGQMGTALTDGQASELAKLAPSVTLCLDPDVAGQDATLRAATVLRGLGSSAPEVRVATLPAGSDPADLAVSDAEGTAALLAAAAPLPRWQVELAIARGDLSSAEGRDRVLDKVKPVIARLPAGLLREELVQLLAGRLGLSESLAAAALSGAPAPAPTGNGHLRPATQRRPTDHAEDSERAFLALCLAFPTAGASRLAAIDCDTLFSSALARRAALHLREHLAAPATGLPSDDDAFSALIAELVLRAHSLEETEPAELERTALILERARLDRAIAAARAAQTPLSELAAERQTVLTELRRLTH